MKTKASTILLTVVMTAWCVHVASAAEPRHEIAFPDIPGYKTLVCDFHMHTVFSDGQVWPSVRVAEAWRQGLDAIAITDHVEYQPHRDDVPTKRNRPYELAVGDARTYGLLLPRATEITRNTPPGHYNAIFLDDVEPLDNDDFLGQIEEANRQGAFVFWNHHTWQGESRGQWSDVQTTMLDRGWLHGMEVANGGTYYPQAHQWCLDKGLTMLGNSDIHAPDLRRESTQDDHRSMTLVFVKEKTLDGLKDALKNGRTVVWYEDRLIGKPEWIEPLCEAMITIEPPHLRTEKTACFRVHNSSVIDLNLQRMGKIGPQEVTIPAGTTTLVKTSTTAADQPIELDYIVTNLLIAPETGLRVQVEVPSK